MLEHMDRLLAIPGGEQGGPGVKRGQRGSEGAKGGGPGASEVQVLVEREGGGGVECWARMWWQCCYDRWRVGDLERAGAWMFVRVRFWRVRGVD
jgi:hypothetical protein